jgi:transposase
MLGHAGPGSSEPSLGLEPPWRTTSAELKLERGRIEALVEYEGEGRCTVCDRVMPNHDHRERTWRHLDIFQYAFYVTARVPRVRCQEHGMQQLPVPWAVGRSGFTALFERAAISLLLQMSITGVARHLKVSWDEMDGIMMRAVARGLVAS